MSQEAANALGLPGTVYQALAEHQCSETAWEGQALIHELHRWAGIFNLEFKLEIPVYSLCIERLRCSRLGHFRLGHNGFGLRGEIAINSLHLGTREPWQVLGTLLHELLHAWQQEHGRAGRRNYHNRQFRGKARGLGLLVDDRGVTQYEPQSLFTQLLAKNQVNVPVLPVPQPVASPARGSSKLKKWSCACTNVRVAVSGFSAMCLRCGGTFERSY